MERICGHNESEKTDSDFVGYAPQLRQDARGDLLIWVISEIADISIFPS